MGVNDLYDSGACNIMGRNNGMENWTWEQYEIKKAELLDKLVLVDMINHPIKDSVTISNELFDGSYPEGTVFVLYCHSGGSSGYLQMQLAPQLPQYKFVNISGGIMSLGVGF